jgi:3-methyl-2-oxobutanoate hydroxymethyltransferase
MKKTKEYISKKKKNGEKITTLTCYDYPTALWEDAAGIDVALVGDSVGVNILGYKSEREVTMEDMIHHLKAARRGINNAYLLVDMPYKSYETTEQALENAERLISAGADGVKLEGVRAEVIRHLSKHRIDVCGHLGYTPQIHDRPGLQAKTADAAIEIIKDAIAIQEAGAWIIVLEMLPEEVSKVVTERLSIPAIGIGAGRYTDGQVLVVTDLLGETPIELKHVTKYEDFYHKAVNAIGNYSEDIRNGQFPSENNVRHLKQEESDALQRVLQRSGQ